MAEPPNDSVSHPGTQAFRCRLCNGLPTWSITRYGDGVASWSCAWCLHLVLEDLVLPNESTMFKVWLYGDFSEEKTC